MKIKSEWELLQSINQKILKTNLPINKNLITSIGDDAAVFRLGQNRYGLITTDLSLEGVHFLLGSMSLVDIGFKAMSANISDIAAMGGKPNFAFISLGIPLDFEQKSILTLYRGFIKAANQSNLIISGGDISKAEKLLINITIYGEKTGKPILRSGAEEGDYIYISGTLGDSLAGFEVMTSKDANPFFKSLQKKHKQPSGRLNLVPEVLKKYSPKAMIDVSDGLLSDLGHICVSSQKGFILEEDKIPFSSSLYKYVRQKKKNLSDYFLRSGEEYELLFTSSKKIDKVFFIKGIKITRIGQIKKNGYFLQKKGILSKVNLKGFDHFNKV
jgi:thiamine-monophosphate kinase